MTDKGEALALGCFFLKSLDGVIPKLFEPATFETDQVVMVLMPQDVFVNELATPSLD